jgi:hypothetical protein
MPNPLYAENLSSSEASGAVSLPEGGRWVRWRISGARLDEFWPMTRSEREGHRRDRPDGRNRVVDKPLESAELLQA